eukprot:CAMPEP_0172627206 /NCGR_PEP_ID=MMETSP1068-20121228/155052_1 /TAXON_ID=35684 /ORGANISM="Pseudopedinella elastica, Strain CCMP716" /LENGTH=97 /DNA_ID=CAMNT_0013437027 /DNA_START=36 /DNA_END=329 /DNA_ORIENTATION=-
MAHSGLRATAGLHAGLLMAECPALLSGSGSGLAGAGTGRGRLLRDLREGARASASVGLAVPIGPGSHLEVTCSRPLVTQPRDRPERWQFAVTIGVGS